MNQIELSIVSPVYMAESIVDELVRRIVKVAEDINIEYEVILVEDGSSDKSWDKIIENANKNPKIKGIRFSRNFGQNYAVWAGLKKSVGDFVIVLDCDLQDDPADIKLLLDKAKDGFDTVFAKRLHRKHQFLIKALSSLYKKLFLILSNKKFSFDNGSFYLLNRKVVNSIVQLNEKPLLMGQVIRWVGFNIGFVYVKHHDRFDGESSYRVSTLLSLVWDGWIYNSDKLLQLVIYLGMLISFLSFVSALLIFFSYFFIDFAYGWSSLIVTMLFSTGLILTSLGILGLYIGRIFEQTKSRPLYIISENINFDI
jgi:polyisoprenyl-phosphate glycosyltransferase